MGNIIRTKLNGETVNVLYNSIEIDQIDTNDYPDFVDAVAIHALDVEGNELTPEQLEEFNMNYLDIVYERVMDILF